MINSVFSPKIDKCQMSNKKPRSTPFQAGALRGRFRLFCHKIHTSAGGGVGAHKGICDFDVGGMHGIAF